MSQFGACVRLGLAALCLGAWSAIAGAASFGENLIRNPGAELDVGVRDRDERLTTPTHWTLLRRAGQPGAVGWNVPGMPNRSSPGPLIRGANYFAGGRANRYGRLSQFIDLSALAVEIDAWTVAFHLSGYIGGRLDEADGASVGVQFVDGGKYPLYHGEPLPGVSAEDRGGVTGLLPRQSRGMVPARTRGVWVVIDFGANDDIYNDAYVDQLSLTLEERPW